MKSRRTNRIVTALLIGGVVIGALLGGGIALTSDLPQIRSLETYTPSAVTRVYSSDRHLLAEFYTEKRDPVALETVPGYLKTALITTEDRKFYRHSGIDVRGILRALIRDIRVGRFVEGASTLTQQLAKTLFLSPRKTFVRKLKEMFLALQLERRYTKDEILELYLNQVYFGSGAYGVAAAAQRFFGKPVAGLTLAECALLAGMPQAPSRYSPLVDPALALGRRNTVLRQMLETGVISTSEYQQAADAPLGLKPGTDLPDAAPYFVSYIKPLLEEAVGSSLLYKGGLSIATTLSWKVQSAAEKAVADGIALLQKRLRGRGTSGDELQAALVCLDVETGAILAMVGGKNFSQSPFNRAASAQRQPGSAFKPLVYALAVQEGASQARLLLDAPVAFTGAHRGTDWKPENFSRTFHGEVSLRYALVHSLNIPAVRLVEQLGPAAVVDFARRMGIESPLSQNLSLALGTSELSLLELTSAYTVFANRGRHVQPFGVFEVVGRDGRSVWRPSQRKSLPMTRAAAAIVTDMLAGVMQQGSGRAAGALPGPVAGKTGTSNDFRDALFVGFSPTIAAGVWVGNDEGGSLGEGETGARAALPIWAAFMADCLGRAPARSFDTPEETVFVRIDPRSGTRVADSSSSGVRALFIRGTEPRTAP